MLEVVEAEQVLAPLTPLILCKEVRADLAEEEVEAAPTNLVQHLQEAAVLLAVEGVAEEDLLTARASRADPI